MTPRGEEERSPKYLSSNQNGSDLNFGLLSDSGFQICHGLNLAKLPRPLLAEALGFFTYFLYCSFFPHLQGPEWAQSARTAEGLAYLRSALAFRIF